MWLEFSFETMTERMGDAGIYALLGLGMVIGVLAVIWGVLSLFGVIFSFRQKRDRAAAITDGDECASDDDDADDGSVAAAISAAVALILEDEAKAENKTASGFRVVSFRRSGGNRPWVR